VAVIVHGYGEHIGRYREVANVLAQGGWGVLGFDQRGHGRSSGQRGHVDRFTEYLDDLDVVRRHARLLADDAKLPRCDAIVAHSHGALITLRALCEPSRHVDADAVVLSSPFLRLGLPVSTARRLLGAFASRLLPTLTQAANIPVEYLTHDREQQIARASDPLCHSVATVRWFTEASAAQTFVSAHVANVGSHTLWLVSADDQIADPTRTRQLGEHLAGATYHHLHGLRHEIFHEIERARVFDLMVNFLRTRAPRSGLETTEVDP